MLRRPNAASLWYPKRNSAKSGRGFGLVLSENPTGIVAIIACAEQVASGQSAIALCRRAGVAAEQTAARVLG